MSKREPSSPHKGNKKAQNVWSTVKQISALSAPFIIFPAITQTMESSPWAIYFMEI